MKGWGSSKEVTLNMNVINNDFIREHNIIDILKKIIINALLYIFNFNHIVFFNTNTHIYEVFSYIGKFFHTHGPTGILVDFRINSYK